MPRTRRSSRQTARLVDARDRSEHALDSAARPATGPDPDCARPYSCCPTVATTVMLTSAGGGHSRWHDIALTRWREDPTRDAWGCYCLSARRGQRAIWSIAVPAHAAARPKPIRRLHRGLRGIPSPPRRFESPHRRSSCRRGRHRAAPRLRITNLSRPERGIEFTSYAGSGARRCRDRRQPASGLQQAVRPDRDRVERAARSCVRAGRAVDATRRPGWCTCWSCAKAEALADVL